MGTQGCMAANGPLRQAAWSGLRRAAAGLAITALAVAGGGWSLQLWWEGIQFARGSTMAPGPWQASSFGWWVKTPVFGYFAILFALATLAWIGACLPWRPGLRRMARRIVFVAALALGAAALWFLGAAVMGQLRLGALPFQVMCLAMFLALCVWFWYERDESLRPRGQLTACALLVAALLPLGQMAISPGPAMVEAREVNQYDLGQGASRVIRPYDSRGRLPVNAMPLLGSPEAPYIVLSFFDYTRDEGRAMQRSLLALRRAFGDQVAVMLAPYPMDRSCNPNVTADMGPADTEACGYAKLALAVWLVKPEAFEAIHQQLTAAEEHGAMPGLSEIQASAAELVGQEPLQRALRDPRLTELLDQSIRAKPRRLSMGRRNERGVMSDSQPCVMWKPKGKDVPGVVTVGNLAVDALLREFEEDTGALPRNEQVKEGPGLMELLEDQP